MFTLAFNIGNQFFQNQQGGVANLTQSPGRFITGLLPNILVLAGIAFFFYIVWGGFDIVVNPGKGANPSEIQKAWQKIYIGLIGFLIVVGSFFILQIMGSLLGVDFINPPTL